MLSRIKSFCDGCYVFFAVLALIIVALLSRTKLDLSYDDE